MLVKMGWKGLSTDSSDEVKFFITVPGMSMTILPSKNLMQNALQDDLG